MSNGERDPVVEVPPDEAAAEPRPGGLDLLDGASADMPVIPADLEARRRIAADKELSIPERIEAYEEIVDSEVGDTSLSRARHLEREHGLRQLYLKFEGSNPSGTQKDRIAFAQAMDALRRGFSGLTVASCGNYGAAVALACHLAGLRCRVYIPASFHTKRIQEMTRFGAEIVRVEGDYERAIEVSRAEADPHDLYDANPGGANTSLQLRAYGDIALEIYDELRDAPAVVAIPVSNGTTLCGIYRGFVSLFRRGKTSRVPQLVAGSSFRKNPIVQAFLKNLPNCSDLAPERIRETVVNEPLINWHSEDGELALEALRDSNGVAGHASDKSLLQTARALREREGLSVLPASTAGLITLFEQHRKQPYPNGRYVVVLTGRRS